jgi:predicted GIY-YIG superfamily endonuclease
MRWITSTVEWVGPLLLTPVEIDRVPRGIPGIYLLLLYLADSEAFWPIYCGQSSDLRARLRQHDGHRSSLIDLPAVRRNKSTYLAAAPVFQRGTRLAMEAGLIQLLRPSLNRQIPPASNALLPTLPNWVLIS